MSVDRDKILVVHSKCLRTRLKYYELHQTPNERKKAKFTFCGGTHDLRPHHHGKKRKDASTDSGLGACAQTLVLCQMKHIANKSIQFLENLMNYESVEEELGEGFSRNFREEIIVKQ